LPVGGRQRLLLQNAGSTICLRISISPGLSAPQQKG
jgi:hypothetical protein